MARMLLTALAVLCVPRFAVCQTDFEKYIDEIRKSGMSESAASDVRAAADLLGGGSTFKASRTPEGYICGAFSGNMCFVPTKDERLLEKQRALRERINAKVDAWAKFLQKQADTDSSGFGSTDEGRVLRREVEMGLIAVQLTPTVDELAKAVFEDRAGVLADIAAYSRGSRRPRSRVWKDCLSYRPILWQRLGDGRCRRTTRCS